METIHQENGLNADHGINDSNDQMENFFDNLGKSNGDLFNGGSDMIENNFFDNLNDDAGQNNLYGELSSPGRTDGEFKTGKWDNLECKKTPKKKISANIKKNFSCSNAFETDDADNLEYFTHKSDFNYNPNNQPDNQAEPEKSEQGVSHAPAKKQKPKIKSYETNPIVPSFTPNQ
jgi:hypothetical protein